MPQSLLALLLSLLVPLSVQGQGSVKRLWETAIEEEASSIECKAAAVSPQDDSVWLVIGRRPAGEMSGRQKLALRGLDSTGKLLSETSLDFLTREASFQRPTNDIAGLAATADGNLAMAWSMGEVVVLNAKSRGLVRRKDLGPGRPDLWLTRALPLSDNGLLLIGRLDTRAIAIRLNRALEVVWEKSAAPPEVGMYENGVVLENDTFFLTGEVYHGGTASMSMWVGRFNANGELVRSVSLPGQLLSVAAAPGGGCALVQGIRGSADLWFRNYDREMKELWNVRLGSGVAAIWPFPLVPVPRAAGDYFVAGTEKFHFLLSRVKAGASIAWTRTFQEQSGSEPELIWNHFLLSTKHSVIIPFTAMAVRSNMQNQIVKVLSVDPAD
jgi:hypothetical protein